ncbi:MAG: ABC transporter ATP-binding protein [Bacteroidetes bacterium]|nr:MAG: ABC transporter ATP-binding protein [Bacteroidota bacterium]
MIVAQEIRKSYGSLNVLKGIDIQIARGEIVSIVGASGAGKSTLLHIIGTLDKADSGSLTINNKTLNKMSDKELSAFRNQNIGFVFQFHHLLPEFTALENVCIPGFIGKRSVKSVEEKARDLLTLLGLSDRLTHKPGELSGGEQQRVAVARSLINDPVVVLADEPSGNLDSETSGELHRLFFDLRNKLNQTFVIVTHNNDLASMADRKLTMKDGLIIESTLQNQPLK